MWKEIKNCSKIFAGSYVIYVHGLSSWEAIFDQAKNQQKIATLEAKSSEAGFWDSASEAQVTLQQLNQLRDRVAPYLDMDSRLSDLETMCELLAEDGAVDGPEVVEQEREIRIVARDMDKLELETLLAGEHDSADAIMEIKAGAGGTDACDWVAMLQKMYLKWAESNGYKCDIIEETEAEIAGFKNTTVIFHGKNVYGYLKAERGVLRLVRISPFDANKRRQTSFASVEVLPDIG